MYITKAKKSKAVHALEAVAADFAPAVRDAFLLAVERAKGKVALTQLSQSVTNGDIIGIQNLIPDLDLVEFKAEITRALETGANNAQEFFPKTIRDNISFDLLNPKTIEYINGYTGDLITGINNDMRKAISSVVEAGITNGEHPYKIAQSIKSTGIGLTNRDANAVINRKSQLKAAGKLSAPQIEIAVGRYEQTLLNGRLERIARTESLSAANQGQQALWDQAVDEGLLEGGLKHWLFTDDDILDDICRQAAAMNSEGVPIKEPFKTPSGDMMQPPQHPNCRCTSVIRFK